MSALPGFPSPIDSWPIRVWVGYAHEELLLDGRGPLFKALGEIFIPATVQLMQPGGLTAYLPTVPAADANPLVPDEVALVCYRSQDAYHHACTASVGGRAYVQLHQTVFRFADGDGKPASHSGFPQRFTAADSGLPEAGYFHLFDTPADWASGWAQVQIAVYEGDNPDFFRKALQQRLVALEQEARPELDGAVVALSERLVVLWSHWLSDSAATDLLTDLPLRTVSRLLAQTVVVPASPAAPFAGVPVQAGSSFNVTVSE